MHSEVLFRPGASCRPADADDDAAYGLFDGLDTMSVAKASSADGAALAPVYGCDDDVVLSVYDCGHAPIEYGDEAPVYCKHCLADCCGTPGHYPRDLIHLPTMICCFFAATPDHRNLY